MEETEDEEEEARKISAEMIGSARDVAVMSVQIPTSISLLLLFLLLLLF